MHKLEDLKVWNKGIELATKVYEVTKSMPNDEKFNLVSQMRRCAVSIPSNIAEGAGRNTDKQFLQFLSHSNGSSYELLTQTIIAKKTKVLTQEIADDLINDIQEIQKMNFGFTQMLRSKSNI